MPNTNDYFDDETYPFWSGFFRDRVVLFGLTLPVIFGSILAIIGIILTATGVFSPIGIALTAMSINLALSTSLAVFSSGVISFSVGVITTYAMQAVVGFGYILFKIGQFLKSCISSEETNYTELAELQLNRTETNSTQLEPTENSETIEDGSDVPPPRRHSTNSTATTNAALTQLAEPAVNLPQKAQTPKYIKNLRELIQTEINFLIKIKTLNQVFAALNLTEGASPALKSLIEHYKKLETNVSKILELLKNIDIDVTKLLNSKNQNLPDTVLEKINEDNFSVIAKLLSNLISSDRFTSRIILTAQIVFRLTQAQNDITIIATDKNTNPEHRAILASHLIVAGQRLPQMSVTLKDLQENYSQHWNHDRATLTIIEKFHREFSRKLLLMNNNITKAEKAGTSGKSMLDSSILGGVILAADKLEEIQTFLKQQKEFFNSSKRLLELLFLAKQFSVLTKNPFETLEDRGSEGYEKRHARITGIMSSSEFEEIIVSIFAIQQPLSETLITNTAPDSPAKQLQDKFSAYLEDIITFIDRNPDTAEALVDIKTMITHIQMACTELSYKPENFSNTRKRLSTSFPQLFPSPLDNNDQGAASSSSSKTEHQLSFRNK